MHTKLGVLLFAGLLTATALPIQAAEPTQYTWALVLNSDGSYGVFNANELPANDGLSRCEGIAPLVNSCTVSDRMTTSWGWGVTVYYSPPIQPVPAGSAVLSTRNVVTFSNGNTAEFNCSLIQPVTPNGIGNPLPPFTSCAFTQNGASSIGMASMTTHIGAYDPSNFAFIGGSLPSTNDVEAGVGSWASEFFTF